MSAYTVVAASVKHIRPMSRTMRREAAVAIGEYGFNPRAGLRRALVASSYARTALQDGQPIAMWGVKATLLGDTGFVWLVLSDEATKMPLSVLREARNELAVIMRDKREVAATVLPNDEAAIRFAVHLGFHDRPNDDGHLSKRELCAAIMADPAYKIPVGDSYVVALGYHPSHGHAGHH